jgi:Kef-type K+ transport system membrane component KefB
VKSATEVLLFLLFDLAAIIVAARLCAALARRVGQPAVIGEIVAGIILGPTVLGRLVPGLPAQLFPPEVPLRQLADLGLVFFMFLVGLELDAKLIRREGRRALAISLGGVIGPFALGVAIAGPMFALNAGGAFAANVEYRPTHTTFALFMGAAMCITAFPVLARILVDRGLYKSPLGTSALCAAAVDDVIAWILLAAVVGLTRTGSVGEAGRTFVLAFIFAALMFTVGRRALAAMAKRFEASGPATVDQVATVVVALLLSAYITEWIGIHAIFGAFLLGANMPHESRLTRELTDKIEDFTVVVLLPVFFTVAGLRTNVFSLDSAALIFWTLAVSAAAIVGKVVGCGFVARVSGYSSRDAMMLGTLMNTRGLTELVILSVGSSLGVLSDRTYAMMVIMALVTTWMAGPILNRLMPRREMVRILSGGDPNPSVTRVLVALGNPATAPSLVDAGVLLVGAQRPAELLLVHLLPSTRAPEFRSGMRDEQAEVHQWTENLRQLECRAAEAGIDARGVTFLTDSVGRDLAEIAATQRCETILIGWHRALIAPETLRALAHRLFKIAECDVAVWVDARGDGMRREHGEIVAVESRDVAANAGVARIAQRVAEGLVSVVSRTESTTNAALAVVAVESTIPEHANFGAHVDGVVERAQCPVLVVRPTSAPVSIRPRLSMSVAATTSRTG